MTKWEYVMCVYEPDSECNLIDYLNRLGSIGWEVIKVSGVRAEPDHSSYYQEIIAKRCISPNETTNSSSPTTLVSY